MIEPRSRAAERVHDAPAAWKGITAALLRYVEARGQLAQVEAQEALFALVSSIVFGVLAAILALGAWILIVPAAIWLLCHKMNWPFEKALVIAGAIHLLFAGILLKGMFNRLKVTRWFTETLVQFSKDRAWLAQQVEKN